MKLFKLIAHVTVTAYTDVEAETEEEAMEIAEERDVELACYGGLPADSWVVSDVDGAPQGTHVEDEEEIDEEDDE